jgi:hypothetical protein
MKTKNSDCHNFLSSYLVNLMSNLKVKLMRSAFRTRHEKEATW